MTTQINSNWRTVAIVYYTITLPPNKREGEEMNTSSLCITMDQKFNGLENEMAKGNDKATPLQKKGNNMAGGWLFCKKKFFSIVEWLLFSTEAMIFCQINKKSS